MIILCCLTVFLCFCIFSFLWLKLFFDWSFSTDKKQVDTLGEGPEGPAPFHLQLLLRMAMKTFLAALGERLTREGLTLQSSVGCHSLPLQHLPVLEFTPSLPPTWTWETVCGLVLLEALFLLKTTVRVFFLKHTPPKSSSGENACSLLSTNTSTSFPESQQFSPAFLLRQKFYPFIRSQAFPYNYNFPKPFLVSNHRWFLSTMKANLALHLYYNNKL